MNRRPLIVAVLAVALAAAGVIDRTGRPGPASAPALPTGPVAYAADRDSTWFCPLANAQPGAGADGTIVIANTRPSAVEGRLTLFPDAGPAAVAKLTIPPRATQVIHEQSLIKAAAVGAVVEMQTGGIAVEQTVSGPMGQATTPCATRTASRWYVADGSSALNSTMFLALFNPFPDDAIVDLTFATDQGQAAPGAFQGIVVHGGSVSSVDIGAHVRRRDHIAVTVNARRGRLAVARLEVRTSPKPGLSLTLASPALEKEWDFPEGIASDGIAERISVYNPSSEPANVDVALTLDQGASAEPFQLKIAPGDRATLDPLGEARIPKSVGHAVTVRSDQPVVAEQSIDYLNAAPRVGLSFTLGATQSAKKWLFAEGSVGGDLDEYIIVHNNSAHATHVSLFAVTGGRRVPLDAVQSVALERGQRGLFRMADVVTNPTALPIEVDATSPVVVERLLVRIGKPGVSQSIGLPLE